MFSPPVYSLPFVFINRIRLHHTMKKMIAVQFCLLMLISSLSGCLGSEDVEKDSDTEKPSLLGDWDVFSVQSVSELPACDGDTDGRLYYIETDSQFQTCANNVWSVIDLMGSDGAMGAEGLSGTDGTNGTDGTDGTDGMDGIDGADGSPGMDGMNGTNGADGQDVNESYIAEMEARIAALEAEIVNLTSCKLVPWGNCARVNLDGMDLSGLDLTGIDLEGASLIGTNFTGAFLNQSSMAGVKAWNATFSSAQLNYADLSGSEFWTSEYNANCNSCHVTANFYSTSMYGADFTNSLLRYVNLSFAFFRDADFTGSDMSYSQITNTYLVPATMADVNLYSANFSGTEIHELDLSGANMMSANLRGVGMYNVDLSGTFLLYSDVSTRTDLTHSSTFSNCDLSNTRFDGTNLTGVIFYGNDLSFTSFSNAIIDDAFLSTQSPNTNTWHQTIWIDGSVYDFDPIWPCELGPWAYCAGVDLSGRDLSGIDLTGIDLRGANLSNTNLGNATLTNADLSFADFTGATGTSYATFTNSNWNLTVWTDGETYDSNQA